jgi:mannose-6-phosphate isomerase-like protein (cupin superfamily)
MATPATANIPGLEISTRDDNAPKLGYGGQIWVHVNGDSTGGTFGMWEGLLPPGGSSPIHIHHNEDECVFVMEGTMLFVCGDQQWESGPGTWVRMPKDVPHGIRAMGDTPVRFLEFFLPAGLEHLFNKLPETKLDTRPDMAKILAVAKRYGLEFVGPMPS